LSAGHSLPPAVGLAAAGFTEFPPVSDWIGPKSAAFGPILRAHRLGGRCDLTSGHEGG
jgi:hypothetical protein